LRHAEPDRAFSEAAQRELARVIGVLPSKEVCAALELAVHTSCAGLRPLGLNSFVEGGTAAGFWLSAGRAKSSLEPSPSATLYYPSLKVDRKDVGPADDRHDPFTSIAGSILQYRCHSKRCRGLHDKSRMAIKQSHSLNDTIFLN
jgi:hypothetical protein